MTRTRTRELTAPNRLHLKSLSDSTFPSRTGDAGPLLNTITDLDLNGLAFPVNAAIAQMFVLLEDEYDRRDDAPSDVAAGPPDDRLAATSAALEAALSHADALQIRQAPDEVISALQEYIDTVDNAPRDRRLIRKLGAAIRARLDSGESPMRVDVPDFLVDLQACGIESMAKAWRLAEATGPADRRLIKSLLYDGRWKLRNDWMIAARIDPFSASLRQRLEARLQVNPWWRNPRVRFVAPLAASGLALLVLGVALGASRRTAAAPEPARIVAEPPAEVPAPEPARFHVAPPERMVVVFDGIDQEGAEARELLDGLPALIHGDLAAKPAEPTKAEAKPGVPPSPPPAPPVKVSLIPLNEIAQDLNVRPRVIALAEPRLIRAAIDLKLGTGNVEHLLKVRRLGGADGPARIAIEIVKLPSDAYRSAEVIDAVVTDPRLKGPLSKPAPVAAADEARVLLRQARVSPIQTAVILGELALSLVPEDSDAVLFAAAANLVIDGKIERGWAILAGAHARNMADVRIDRLLATRVLNDPRGGVVDVNNITNFEGPLSKDNDWRNYLTADEKKRTELYDTWLRLILRGRRS